MRRDITKEKIFTVEIGKLRVLSNQQRKLEHDKIINWEDDVPLKSGNRGLALTMVLPTKGCKYAMAKHGGCSMCTLPMDNPLQPSTELIESLPERTFELFNKKGGKEKYNAVKFYTSGSYLDKWELPVEIREGILAKFTDIVEEITIETRCEFVNDKNLRSLLKVVPKEKLIVAIGQETLDDEVNKRSINKGHTKKQFERAVNLCKKYGIAVKGYILLKSIFMSELQAIEDAIFTAIEMKKIGVENISINSAYIGKATLMDELFKAKRYTPPWLWTVWHVTLEIKKIVGPDVKVICDPVAAGSERGPRNCGNCDKMIKSRLKEFSADQNLDHIVNLNCECKKLYYSIIQTEILSDGMGNFYLN